MPIETISGFNVEIISNIVTGVFALLVAIVAIISPVITTNLNHKFELKLIELKSEERKQETISIFLSELAFIAGENPHNFCGFSKEALSIVQYLPEKYINLLILFISELETKHESLIPDAQITFGDLWYDHKKYQIETQHDMDIYYYQIVNMFVEVLNKKDALQ